MEDEEAGAESSAQAKLRKKYEQMQQAAAQEAELKAVMRRVLAPEAYERVMNVKISNPQLYGQLVSAIAYLVQTGRIDKQLSEEQIVQLLKRMTEKRETKIEFKRK